MCQADESLADFQADRAFSTHQVESAARVAATCLLCASALEVVLTNVVDNRLGTPGSYEIRRCVHCALEQTFPLPSPQQLKELYETHYNFGGERDTLYARLRERFFCSFLYRMWARVDGDVSFHCKRGVGLLVDIGCNEGRGLRIYARNGFRVEGLELSETAAAVARRTGFNIHTCLLSEFDPVSRYNVAVMSNVLEHSLDPRQMLRDVRRILADGSEVWISCPNSESWLRTLFGRSWINWHVPFHTAHFNASTLRQLLADTGYSDIQIRQITPALWVAQSFLALLFAEKGKKTVQLRSPLWASFVTVFARFLLFPALWLGNKCGKGDCLLAFARKA